MRQEKPQNQVILLDTSAILSGKPFNTDDCTLMTTRLIADELTKGGRDYRFFEYLQAKGLEIHSPTKKSCIFIKKIAKQHGEDSRLSNADIELLALGVEVAQIGTKSPIIYTDDYSIQNIAALLKIHFEPISQKGITKKFKWVRRCQGCKRIINESVDACPFCGSSIDYVVQKKSTIKWKE